MARHDAMAKNPRHRNFRLGMGGAMSEYRDVIPFMMGGGIAGAVIGYTARGSQTAEQSLKPRGSASNSLLIGSITAAALGLSLVALRHV